MKTKNFHWEDQPREKGKINFFLLVGNHLGNVLQVVTDRKLAVSDDGIGVDYYVADVVSQRDYYPFGMVMPNRNESGDEYRYGFNGMEKDDEVTAQEGTSYDFGARFYNPRVGRFLSRDPKEKEFAFIGPYAFAENSPILLIDKNGEDGEPPILTLGAKYALIHIGYSDMLIHNVSSEGLTQTRLTNISSVGVEEGVYKGSSSVKGSWSQSQAGFLGTVNGGAREIGFAEQTFNVEKGYHERIVELSTSTTIIRVFLNEDKTEIASIQKVVVNIDQGLILKETGNQEIPYQGVEDVLYTKAEEISITEISPEDLTQEQLDFVNETIEQNSYTGAAMKAQKLQDKLDEGFDKEQNLKRNQPLKENKNIMVREKKDN